MLPYQRLCESSCISQTFLSDSYTGKRTQVYTWSECLAQFPGSSLDGAVESHVLPWHRSPSLGWNWQTLGQSDINFFLSQNSRSGCHPPIYLTLDIVLFSFNILTVVVSSQKLPALCSMSKRGNWEYKQYPLKIFSRFKEMSAKQCKWFSRVTHGKRSMFHVPGCFHLWHPVATSMPCGTPCIIYSYRSAKKKIPSSGENPYLFIYFFYHCGTLDGELFPLMYIICWPLSIIHHKNP